MTTYTPSKFRSFCSVLAASLIFLAAGEVSAKQVIAEGLAVSSAQFAVAKEVQRKNEGSLLRTPGVTAVGIGLDEEGTGLALHVFVNAKERGSAAVLAATTALELPVRIVESEKARAFDAGPAHRQQYSTPVPMGTSTGNDNGCFAGTLSARVIRAGQSGTVGYITNAHVASAGGANLCPGAAAFGEDQFQRALFDAVPQCTTTGIRKIGDLVQYIPIVFGGSFENTVDVAFVASSRSLVSKTILDIGNPSPSLLTPALNMPVQKSGRTTGRQFGTISAVNVTVQVDYGDGCGTAKFVNQFAVTPGSFSAAGDSGSLILHRTLRDGSGRFRPVGLLFAGSDTVTFANRIADVLGALSASVDTQ